MSEDEAEALGWDLVLEEEAMKHDLERQYDLNCDLATDLAQAEALLDECEGYLDFIVSVYVGDDKALDLLNKLRQRKELK